MSISVVDEAAGWADELMEAEWRGRRDNEASVGFRLARRLGIPESYLFRLQYKSRDMTDVRGSVYRALMHGREMYGLACQANEDAAAAMRAERLQLKAERHAVDRKPAAAGVGEAVARD